MYKYGLFTLSQSIRLLHSLPVYLLSSLLSYRDLIQLQRPLVMEQPSSPSQCTGDHTRDGHDPRNCSCALYELVYSFAHPPEPAETLATQPAAALSSQGVALSPCFFGPPGPAIPNIWFDPAVEVAGVSSTTDGSRACSSPNTSASDWARALSLSSPNDVEAADESLLYGPSVPFVAFFSFTADVSLVSLAVLLFHPSRIAPIRPLASNANGEAAAVRPLSAVLPSWYAM